MFNRRRTDVLSDAALARRGAAEAKRKPFVRPPRQGRCTENTAKHSRKKSPNSGFFRSSRVCPCRCTSFLKSKAKCIKTTAARFLRKGSGRKSFNFASRFLSFGSASVRSSEKHGAFCGRTFIPQRPFSRCFFCTASARAPCAV